MGGRRPWRPLVLALGAALGLLLLADEGGFRGPVRARPRERPAEPAPPTGEADLPPTGPANADHAGTEVPRAAGELRDVLRRETDPEARRAAIAALGRLGDDHAVDVLLDLTRQGGTEALLARLALDDVRDPAAILHGIERWAEIDAPTRLALLHAARYADAALFVAAARAALFDPDERVRAEAITVLGRAGDPAVEPLLDHALRGEETEQAIRALAGLGTPKAAEAGLLALDGISPRRQEWYRTMFLSMLGR